MQGSEQLNQPPQSFKETLLKIAAEQEQALKKAFGLLRQIHDVTGKGSDIANIIELRIRDLRRVLLQLKKIGADPSGLEKLIQDFKDWVKAASADQSVKRWSDIGVFQALNAQDEFIKAMPDIKRGRKIIENVKKGAQEAHKDRPKEWDLWREKAQEIRKKQSRRKLTNREIAKKISLMLYPHDPSKFEAIRKRI